MLYSSSPPFDVNIPQTRADNRQWLQSHINDINLDIEETREIVTEAQSIAEETYETLTTITNIVLLSLGDNITTQGDLQPVDIAEPVPFFSDFVPSVEDTSFDITFEGEDLTPLPTDNSQPPTPPSFNPPPIPIPTRPPFIMENNNNQPFEMPFPYERKAPRFGQSKTEFQNFFDVLQKLAA